MSPIVVLRARLPPLSIADMSADCGSASRVPSTIHNMQIRVAAVQGIGRGHDTQIRGLLALAVALWGCHLRG